MSLKENGISRGPRLLYVDTRAGSIPTPLASSLTSGVRRVWDRKLIVITEGVRLGPHC